MKISTEIGSAAYFVGEEKAIEYIARAGFDAWDFTMFDMCLYDWNTNKIINENNHPLAGNDYLKFARRLKQVGLDNGIICNQSHAPMPTTNIEVRSYLKRAIECTAEAGGEICVIHPHHDYSPHDNAELYLELLPFAKDCGVKIATENMCNWDDVKEIAYPAACYSPENFKAHLDAVDDDFFVACVDVGHAELKGLNTSASRMIRYLGDKVQAIHIHDNDKRHDMHRLPYTMSIEFEPILKALKDIAYKGYLTMESDRHIRFGPFTAENVYRGVEDFAAVAKKMRDYFESL